MLGIFETFCESCPQRESCVFKHEGETAIQRFGYCTAQGSAADLIVALGTSGVPVDWSPSRKEVFGE